MILAVIVACEIAFWVFIVAGLLLRYPLRRPRAGLVVLALVPLIDVVLLVATGLDLRSGSTATIAHTLAAFYLGFSLAYGRRMIGWADARFAHRYAGGPPPRRLDGTAYTKSCWADVGRTAAAVGIACLVAWGLIAWVGDESRTQQLASTYDWAGLILGIEVLWATSYTIWPRKPKALPVTDLVHQGLRPTEPR